MTLQCLKKCLNSIEPGWEPFNTGGGIILAAKDIEPINADGIKAAVFVGDGAATIYWDTPVEAIKAGAEGYRPLCIDDFKKEGGKKFFTAEYEDVILDENNHGDVTGMLTMHDLEPVKKVLKVMQKWTGTPEKPVIYLAGPDVFYPDARIRGEIMKEICEEYGFDCIFPLDNEPNNRLEYPEDIAFNIADKNKNSISLCHIVAANLTPFRGPEPDSGTVFECGLARGMGKHVYAYVGDASLTLVDSVRKFYGKVEQKDGIWRDKDNLIIENFGLRLNLMLENGAQAICGQFENCIKKIREDINNNLIHII